MAGLTTSFKLCREHGACDSGYRKLAKSLGGVEKYGDETPISLLHIMDSNGPEDCLWALRAVPAEQEKLRDRFARLIACDCAALALPIFERDNPTDRRPRDAILTAERYANGEATDGELDAAWDAARAAARDASWDAARDAAWDAARAAARDAARAAARAAARDAAWDAAWAAARDAARDAARAAARDAAWAAAWAAQKDLIRARLIEAEAY